jgi:hypothetical protein
VVDDPAEFGVEIVVVELPVEAREPNPLGSEAPIPLTHCDEASHEEEATLRPRRLRRSKAAHCLPTVTRAWA